MTKRYMVELQVEHSDTYYVTAQDPDEAFTEAERLAHAEYGANIYIEGIGVAFVGSTDPDAPVPLTLTKEP